MDFHLPTFKFLYIELGFFFCLLKSLCQGNSLQTEIKLSLIKFFFQNLEKQFWIIKIFLLRQIFLKKNT